MDILDKAQELEELHREESLANIKKIAGESLEFCKDCDARIPDARRNAYAGVQYCIGCQVHHE